jgi:hypothetical protein
MLYTSGIVLVALWAVLALAIVVVLRRINGGRDPV